ncbi:PAQR family membrane homeostasis protein TrhA [Roseinatronobacter alkalisoli]|nr:hemolysin III family protein [Roseinatronobacter sp. HJB301]
MLLRQRHHYTAAEQRMDAAIHVVGLVGVLVAVPLMIGAALFYSQGSDRPWTFLAVAVYGLAFMAMIGASALYNLTPGAGLNWLFRRLDHSAIYVKIAGTYTPFTLISGQGVWLMAGLWAAALCGVVLKCLSPERFHWPALVLYLGMGWVGVMILPQMLATLPLASVVLIIAGGLVYTLGVLFYLWTRLRFHYAIWHVFVLTASFLFYAAVMVLVVQGATA